MVLCIPAAAPYLNGDLVAGLRRVALDDMSSGDGGNVERSFLFQEEPIPTVVNLGGTANTNICCLRNRQANNYTPFSISLNYSSRAKAQVVRQSLSLSLSHSSLVFPNNCLLSLANFLCFHVFTAYSHLHSFLQHLWGRGSPTPLKKTFKKQSHYVLFLALLKR